MRSPTGSGPVIRAAFTAWLAPENFDEAGGQRRALGDIIAGAGSSSARV
jgi:hypothetical protein